MFCIDCCFQSVTNRGDEKVWLVSDEEVQDFYWPGLICELRDWLPGPHGINTVCLKFEKESQLSPEENQQSQRKVNVLFDFQSFPIISTEIRTRTGQLKYIHSSIKRIINKPFFFVCIVYIAPQKILKC